MGFFVQNPNKPAEKAGSLFRKLNIKSEKCFNFHKVGFECNLGPDCQDNHTPINKMNTSRHKAILMRHLMDKTVFLQQGLKDNETFMFRTIQNMFPPQSSGVSA